MPPKVSVNICCYNSEKFVRMTIQSVLDQTFKDLEIIVLDDGSKDATGKIVRSFSDPRIKYFYQENHGLSFARNRAMQLSSGDFIALLDHDDRWLPQKLEKQMALFGEDRKIGLVYSDCYVNFLGTGKKILYSSLTPYYQGEVLKQLLENCFIPLPTIVFRKEVVTAVGGFSEKFKLNEDYDFLARLASKYKIAFINEPLAEYVVHSGNESRNAINMRQEEIMVLESNIAAFRSVATEAQIKRRLKRLYLGLAILYGQKGDYKGSNQVIDESNKECGQDLKLSILRIFNIFPAFYPILSMIMRSHQNQGMWGTPVSSFAEMEDRSAGKKLKICFIGWASSEHVKSWVKWFSGRGHEVHLISNVYEEIPGVKVHALQDRTAADLAEDKPAKTGWLADLISRAKFNYLSYLRYPGYIKITRRLIAEIKPDILQGFYIGFAGYLGAFAGFHPFLVFTGGPDLLVFPRQSLFHRIWTKYALSKIDFLTHTSEEANAAAVGFGFPANRSRFMHIGIDLRQFNPAVDPGDLKARLGIAGKPMILSTRGLFDKYYNITGLLRTFALVLGEVPEARLVLKYYSAPEKEKFIKLAKKLAIYDKIVWAGKADYCDLPQYFRAADTYVSLSFTDSGPVSMLEAMACGCVPVVSNLKNIGEWVKDGINGHLVDPRDYPGAARAIIGLLCDQAKRGSMGQNNAALIKERADQEKCMAEIERVSYQLVEGKI